MKTSSSATALLSAIFWATHVRAQAGDPVGDVKAKSTAIPGDGIPTLNTLNGGGLVTLSDHAPVKKRWSNTAVVPEGCAYWARHQDNLCDADNLEVYDVLYSDVSVSIVLYGIIQYLSAVVVFPIWDAFLLCFDPPYLAYQVWITVRTLTVGIYFVIPVSRPCRRLPMPRDNQHRQPRSRDWVCTIQYLTYNTNTKNKRTCSYLDRRKTSDKNFLRSKVPPGARYAVRNWISVFNRTDVNGCGVPASAGGVDILLKGNACLENVVSAYIHEAAHVLDFIHRDKTTGEPWSSMFLVFIGLHIPVATDPGP